MTTKPNDTNHPAALLKQLLPASHHALLTAALATTWNDAVGAMNQPAPVPTLPVPDHTEPERLVTISKAQANAETVGMLGTMAGMGALENVRSALGAREKEDVVEVAQRVRALADNTLATASPYWPRILVFALEMNRQMELHAGQYGDEWRRTSPYSLAEASELQTMKLGNLLHAPGTEGVMTTEAYHSAILRRGAHAANLAWMSVDAAGALPSVAPPGAVPVEPIDPPEYDGTGQREAWCATPDAASAPKDPDDSGRTERPLPDTDDDGDPSGPF